MGKIMACSLFAAIVILCSLTHVRSDASDHRYKVGEDVPLYANKVGPFHNPRYIQSISSFFFFFLFSMIRFALNWIRFRISFPARFGLDRTKPINWIGTFWDISSVEVIIIAFLGCRIRIQFQMRMRVNQPNWGIGDGDSELSCQCFGFVQSIEP